MDLLIATTNPGKLPEIEAALNELPVRILSLKDFPHAPEVVEDGATYEENALKKARTIAAFSGLPTLADDSGLEVDALGGAPGIYSARYSGEGADDARNNRKLLDQLAGLPEDRRSARFVCALALSAPQGEWLFRAECPGRIAFEPRGAHGFGYDPLFLYAPLGRTFGELDRETKSHVSHRGLALQKLKSALPALPVFSKRS
ncbi:MAG TPA: XTP/dITP diphosphatase [Candidatus Binatia bacterium]|nr:XTP/dITP diphosphatase [Candidatus Binatia bacterium]